MFPESQFMKLFISGFILASLSSALYSWIQRRVAEKESGTFFSSLDVFSLPRKYLQLARIYSWPTWPAYGFWISSLTAFLVGCLILRLFVAS